MLQIHGFIRGAKNTGFTLKQIRALFSVAYNTGVDFNYVEELISTKIVEINEKIYEDLLFFLYWKIISSCSEVKRTIW